MSSLRDFERELRFFDRADDNLTSCIVNNDPNGPDTTLPRSVVIEALENMQEVERLTQFETIRQRAGRAIAFAKARGF